MQKKIDKKSNEKRDNAHAQGEGPSNPQTPPSFLQGKFDYPLEILVRHLVNEEEYINYGIEQHYTVKAAFEESNRLANERIPQLRLAIKILLSTK